MFGQPHMEQVLYRLCPPLTSVSSTYSTHNTDTVYYYSLASVNFIYLNFIQAPATPTMICSRVSLPAVHQNPGTPARRSLPPISEMLSDIQQKRHHPPQQGYYASLPSKSMADRNEPEGAAYDPVYHDYRSASGDRRQLLASAPQPDQTSHMPVVYRTPQSQTQIGLIHYDPRRGGCAEFLPRHYMNWSYQQFFGRVSLNGSFLLKPLSDD